MNRKELAQIIAKKMNLSRKSAENLVIAFETVVSDALARGDKIVYSNFGSFYTVNYPSRIITHPRLGAAKKIVMLPTNAAKWMPSENIKKMVDSGKFLENATVHGKKRVVPSIVSEPVKKNSPAKEKILKKSKDKLDSKTKKRGSSEDDEEVQIPIRTKHTHLKRHYLNSVAKQKVDVPKENIKEKDPKIVDIYEELMKDGSKIESTFSDAIRIPYFKAEAFFNKLLKAKEDKKEKPQMYRVELPQKHVSLAGAGIFDDPEIKRKIDEGHNPNDPTPEPETESESVEIPIKTINTESKPESANEVEKNGSIEEKKEISTGYDPKLGTEELPKDLPAPLYPDVTTPVEYVNLSKTVVPKEILQKIPERIARQYQVVPISEKDDEMTVAMIDPEDIEAREIIKKYVQESIVIKLTTDDDLNHVLDQYSGLESEIESAIELADDEDDQKSDPKDKVALVESASDNAPAAKIVTSLLRRAIREKASDIHIEPGETDVEVRFRLDGILKKTASLPKDMQAAVVSRIKILSNLKIDEQRMPQDGRFSLTVDNRKIDFRVSTMPVANGEKVVMRVLDKVSGILTIEQLGIRGTGLEALKRNIIKSHGMTLVTGPTGSGKTTTLYALIERIYNETINIITLEDPIEYRMPGINQSQVNAEIDYTFASGLRSIVRQDPDVIMIGEIRDPETAEMAVHAALTGHVVLSTLHTNDSAGAAPRIMDMGVEPFLLTSSINCIVGQRLARKICEDCKVEVKPNNVEKAEIKKIIDELPPSEKKLVYRKPIKLWKGKGCKSCGNSGYKGRLGVYEVLDITEEIKEMILKKESSFQIQKKAIEQGMVTMAQDGVLKALDGITSLEEVWRVIRE